MNENTPSPNSDGKSVWQKDVEIANLLVSNLITHLNELRFHIPGVSRHALTSTWDEIDRNLMSIHTSLTNYSMYVIKAERIKPNQVSDFLDDMVENLVELREWTDQLKSRGTKNSTPPTSQLWSGECAMAAQVQTLLAALLLVTKQRCEHLAQTQNWPAEPQFFTLNKTLPI